MQGYQVEKLKINYHGSVRAVSCGRRQVSRVVQNWLESEQHLLCLLEKSIVLLIIIIIFHYIYTLV
jgi:hypothetical protein